MPLTEANCQRLLGSRRPEYRSQEQRQSNRVPVQLRGYKKQLQIVPGASHLFAEPGALEQVARFARYWFQQHLLRSNL
jgi:hypothetical protein